MFKIKSSLTILILLFTNYCSFSQTSPSLQFTVGLDFPTEGFKGELVSTDDFGVSNINEDFIKKNYGTSTGVGITGTIKFPLDAKAYVKGLIIGSYSYFNVFKRVFFGVTSQGSTTVPISFDNRFSVSTFGLGIEASPSPTSKISPFINSSFTFNFLSMTLSRNGFTSIIFNDAFRGGMLTNAGVTINLNQEYSIVVGGSYHLSNLLFTNHKDGFNDRIEYNRDNVPINDEEGMFYTNLSTPNNVPSLVSGSAKNVNWWGFNIGLNIMLGKSKKK